LHIDFEKAALLRTPLLTASNAVDAAEVALMLLSPPAATGALEGQKALFCQPRLRSLQIRRLQLRSLQLRSL